MQGHNNAKESFVQPGHNLQKGLVFDSQPTELFNQLEALRIRVRYERTAVFKVQTVVQSDFKRLL